MNVDRALSRKGCRMPLHARITQTDAMPPSQRSRGFTFVGNPTAPIEPPAPSAPPPEAPQEPDAGPRTAQTSPPPKRST